MLVRVRSPLGQLQDLPVLERGVLARLERCGCSARVRGTRDDVPAAHVDVPPSASAGPLPADVDRGVLATAGELLETVGRSSKQLGRLSTDQVERMSKALVRRSVSRAVTEPAAIADRRALEEALAEERTSVGLSASSATLLAGRVMRRLRPFQRLAGKAPAMAAVTALPELYSSIADGLDDLGALASFLVRRAEREGVVVDEDRVRRTAVQLLGGIEVDPDTEPEHDRLLWSWVRRSVRRSLPFGRRAGRIDVKQLAARAASIDVRTLRAPAAARGRAAAG